MARQDLKLGSKSAARRAFAYYLRTGWRLAVDPDAPGPEQRKFNPYHDPRNGRFTFAPGGPRSLSNIVISDRRSNAPKPDRRPDPPAAPKPARQRSLGALSERYEAPERGVGTISTGKGDPGGVSYGSYQLSSNAGTATAFVASPEFRPWAAEFRSLEPGTSAFSAKWRAVAARDPEAFLDAQRDFIRRTHYDPAVAKVARMTGYDLNSASDAVREVTFSVSVQHGGATTILADAVKRTDQKLKRSDPGYERALIDKIYDRRTEYMTALRDQYMARGLTKEARTLNNAIVNRYPRERADAQRMLQGQ